MTGNLEHIDSLSPEEFHELALKQKDLHPDLLKITDEEGIIDSFYDHYHRKRNKTSSRLIHEK